MIAKATPTLQVVDNSNTGYGQQFVASVAIAGVNGQAGASLEGVVPTVVYYAGAIALPATAGAVGTYTAIALRRQPGLRPGQCLDRLQHRSVRPGQHQRRRGK